MDHQGTKIEREIVVEDNQAHEKVKKVSVSHQASDAEVSLGRIERFRTIGLWIIGCTCALLGARIVLNLFAANQAAGFTQAVTTLTAPLVIPFTAIFGMPTVGASILDTAALVALVVYPIVGYGIISLIIAVTAPNDPTGSAYE